MKTHLLLTAAVLVALTIGILPSPAQAQTLKWTYTVNPSSPWNLNGLPNVIEPINDESGGLFCFAPDGLGGGAFVLFEYINNGTNEYAAPRVVWLNRLGKLIYDSSNDNAFTQIPSSNTPNFSIVAEVVKVTSTQLMLLVQASVSSGNFQSIVDFTATKTGIKNLHIPLSPTAKTLLHPSTADPSGFFLYDQSGSGFTITRYSYAVPK